MNKDIKYLVEKLFDDDLFDNNDELTLDELNIVDNLDPDYVDLGLPSKTLWCKHNVGANSSEEYGLYFTFEDSVKKYKLPSNDLFIELWNECNWKSSRLNGVEGFKVIGKNNKFIFLPGTGKYQDYYTLNPDNNFFCGAYLSSTLYENPEYSYALTFTRRNEVIYPKSLILSNKKVSIRTVLNKNEI